MAVPVLNLVVLRAADLERAAAFYATLGMQLSQEQHGNGPVHLAGRLGSVVFEVYPKGNAAGSEGARVGLLVPSVAEAVAASSQAGGSVVSPPKSSSWGLRAVVADPDGHRVELLEE